MSFISLLGSMCGSAAVSSPRRTSLVLTLVSFEDHTFVISLRPRAPEPSLLIQIRPQVRPSLHGKTPASQLCPHTCMECKGTAWSTRLTSSGYEDPVHLGLNKEDRPLWEITGWL